MLPQLRPALRRLHYAWIHRCGHLCGGDRDRRGAGHSWRPDRSARTGIPLVAGDDLVSRSASTSLLYGAIGPFAAAIMDRYGVRRR